MLAKVGHKLETTPIVRIHQTVWSAFPDLALIKHHGARRYLNGTVSGVPPQHVLTQPMPTNVTLEVRSDMRKRAQLGASFKDDVTTTTAISTVWYSGEPRYEQSSWP